MKSTFWDALGVTLGIGGYGSGGGGKVVPRSRLKTDVGNQEGMLSSFAMRIPATNMKDAIVRGPLQSQSGRTTSVGW